MPPVRIAALYDIHGNLPALEAVLAEVASAQVDAIVVGGDVASGPLPAETLERLMALGLSASFVMGNADRETVASFDRGRFDEELGSDDPRVRMDAFTASRITRRQRDFLSSFAPAIVLEVEGLGAVRFCHGSPRSDTEKLTPLTAPERLREVLAGIAEPVVVCGHTHQQFDVRLDEVDGAGAPPARGPGSTPIRGPQATPARGPGSGHSRGPRRVVNAGSVGLPYEGRRGAFWALLGPDVELRCTEYDVPAAVAEMRRGGYPGLDELLLESLLEPADPAEVSRFFEQG